MKLIKKHRNICLRIMDILIIIISYYISEIIIENRIILAESTEKIIFNTIIIAVIIYQAVLTIFKTYHNITRYENGKDYLVYVLACLVACSIMIIFNVIPGIPIVGERVNLVAALIIVTSIISYRVILRILLTSQYKNPEASETGKKKVLIIGAGEATRILLGTIKSSMKEIYSVVGLIDDNINKVNYAISGNKILGTRYDIPRICNEKKVDVIFFTISNISNKDRKDILEICQQTQTKVRILPGTTDLINNKNIMSNFRDIEIEDLLGRDPIKLDNKNIGKLIENKVVLVTGGGGSIGSELCRQVMKFNPKELVIVDIYENNLYDIEQELRMNYPEAKIDAIVASVRDKERLNEIFEEFKPYLVFHAAAHKHVPLMETSPLEAIKNNVFGTYNVVNCADEYNVKRFILISTDKAVNPTNIMGATKRLCEMIVQAKNKVSKTEYAAVRFGNVLGSNGSVVPLFKKQIASGGPVTVTHKDITRFFMTIPEAVSLVLQAMSYAKGGEIFVLDMGEPVKIYDMAVNLIKLSGLEPNVDVEIRVTGLRPGEKLYEEILMAEEGLEATKHDKIHIAEPMNINMDMIESKLQKLNDLLETSDNEDKDKIKNVIKQIVPTFRDGKQLNAEKMKEYAMKNEENIKDNSVEVVEHKKVEAIA